MSEIIKIKCKFCQTINDIGSTKCCKCGNNLAIYGEPILSDDSAAGSETVQQDIKPPIEKRYMPPETKDGQQKKDKSPKRRRQKKSKANSTEDAPKKGSRKKPIIIGAAAAAVIALCVVLVVVVIPRLPFGRCGDDLKWNLSGGTLTISGTGDMWNWNDESDLPWAKIKWNIEYVVIESGVTSIGDYAFYFCGEMNDITIPTGITRIGKRAFYSCFDLTEITIPSGVETIDKNAFRACLALTKVTLPDSVTSIGESAFESCRSLTSVNYKGAKDNWNNIDIADGNDCLLSAKKTYGL